jgi:hypothetical protein
MLLYDCFCFSARTGRQLAACDFDRPAPARAPKGEVIQCVNTNWDGHQFWLDDQGHQFEQMPDVVRHALTDEGWIHSYLRPGHFDAPDEATARLWLKAVRRDAGARPQDMRRIRQTVERGEKVRLLLAAKAS